ASPPPIPEMPSGSTTWPLASGAWPCLKRGKVHATKRSENSGTHGTSLRGSRLSYLIKLSSPRTLPGLRVRLGHYPHRDDWASRIALVAPSGPCQIDSPAVGLTRTAARNAGDRIS